MDKKVNVTINEGKEFFAHEASINFNPMQFIFDFRSVTPRIDPRSREAPTLAIRHNVVMIDPYHVQQFHNLLSEVIKKYESEFGKIEKPNAIKKYEAKMKSVQGQKETIPNYFG